MQSFAHNKKLFPFCQVKKCVDEKLLQVTYFRKRILIIELELVRIKVFGNNF